MSDLCIILKDDESIEELAEDIVDQMKALSEILSL